jgi:purine nucleosidase
MDIERIEKTNRTIILTTDCGAEVDDQWALAHLALSPEFALQGIITTHDGEHEFLAPPAAETSARVAGEVLDHLSLQTRPPVISGSDHALHDKSTPLQNPGVNFILETSRAYTPSQRLTVVVIGAATDIASALLLDPHLAERIEIIAMGFNQWPEGTDPFNVKNDVSAWQVLLESQTPIVGGDTTVTARYLRMTRERAQADFSSRGVSGRYLADLFVSWINTNGDLCEAVSGNRFSWPIWDEVAVAYLLGFTHSEVYPRPALRDDMTFVHPTGAADTLQLTPAESVTWITTIDADRLWADLQHKLDRDPSLRSG